MCVLLSHGLCVCVLCVFVCMKVCHVIVYSYTIGASGVSDVHESLVYGRARGRSPSGLRKLSHECSI